MAGSSMASIASLALLLSSAVAMPLKNPGFGPGGDQSGPQGPASFPAGNLDVPAGGSGFIPSGTAFAPTGTEGFTKPEVPPGFSGFPIPTGFTKPEALPEFSGFPIPTSFIPAPVGGFPNPTAPVKRAFQPHGTAFPFPTATGGFPGFARKERAVQERQFGGARHSGFEPHFPVGGPGLAEPWPTASSS